MKWSSSLFLLAAALFAAVPAQAEERSDRVIGGIDAVPGDWPFQAFVLIDQASGQFACGGTLIAPTWVLTAAHCTGLTPGTPFPASAYSVRFNSVLKGSGGELRKVVRAIPHEMYAQNHQLENDIALLQLDRPVSLEPVALEEAGGMRSGANLGPWAQVLGWGLRTGGDPNSGSEVLQAAALPLVDSELCDRSMRARLPSAGRVDARRVCAGPSEGGVDSCNGDSGGPLLVADDQGRWKQVGVVSYGVKECGSPGAYGVYTRVGAFTDWIAAKTGMAQGGGWTGTQTAPLQIGLQAAAPTLVKAALENSGDLRVQILPKGLDLGDTFRISVTSPRAGYLALFDVGPDNKVTQIFPNERSQAVGKDGRIAAGQTLSFPDPSYGFQFRASEPKGRGRLIAVVAEDRATLAGLARPEDGLKSIPDASGRFARLEVVLKEKPQGSVQADGGTGQASEKIGDWTAGLTDYVIR